MKKRVIMVLGAMALTAVLASCDSKLCYCYENGVEQQMYVSSDVPCSTYTSGNRGCVEANERMDPGTTAYK